MKGGGATRSSRLKCSPPFFFFFFPRVEVAVKRSPCRIHLVAQICCYARRRRRRRRVTNKRVCVQASSSLSLHFVIIIAAVCTVSITSHYTTALYNSLFWPLPRFYSSSRPAINELPASTRQRQKYKLLKQRRPFYSMSFKRIRII